MCNGFCIGKIDTNIKTRYLENDRSYRLQKIEFTLANRCLENPHSFPALSNTSI